MSPDDVPHLELSASKLFLKIARPTGRENMGTVLASLLILAGVVLIGYLSVFTGIITIAESKYKLHFLISFAILFIFICLSLFFIRGWEKYRTTLYTENIHLRNEIALLTQNLQRLEELNKNLVKLSDTEIQKREQEVLFQLASLMEYQLINILMQVRQAIFFSENASASHAIEIDEVLLDREGALVASIPIGRKDGLTPGLLYSLDRRSTASTGKALLPFGHLEINEVYDDYSLARLHAAPIQQVFWDSISEICRGSGSSSINEFVAHPVIPDAFRDYSRDSLKAVQSVMNELLMKTRELFYSPQTSNDSKGSDTNE